MLLFAEERDLFDFCRADPGSFSRRGLKSMNKFELQRNPPEEESIGGFGYREASNIGANSFGHNTAKHPATIAKTNTVFPVPNSVAIFATRLVVFAFANFGNVVCY